MNDFSVYVPFSSKIHPDIVKGCFVKNADGSQSFVETPAGEAFFKNPTDGSITKDWYLEGIASTVDIDRDTERMSEKAIKKMLMEVLDHPVNIFGNHEHAWENSLGVIKHGEILNGTKFFIKFLCDDPQTNPKVPMLINKLKRGIGLGLSIGGKVLDVKDEFNKALGKHVKVIDDLELYETSVVGIASNKFCSLSISQQIAKSAKLEKTAEPNSNSDDLVTKEGEDNPWAICHSQGLTGDKFERCVMDIKRKQGEKSCDVCWTKAINTELLCKGCGATL